MLYNISKEKFNMGISDYIGRFRIKSAVKLLTEQKLPVFRVAEEEVYPMPII